MAEISRNREEFEKASSMEPEDFVLTPEEQARLDEANRQEKARPGAAPSHNSAESAPGNIAAHYGESDPYAATEMKWKDPAAELENIEQRLEALKQEQTELKARKREIENQVKTQKSRRLKIHDAA